MSSNVIKQKFGWELEKYKYEHETLHNILMTLYLLSDIIV